MKVVILAGGKGTRISEETDSIPKPMVQIGSMPLLWHVMKIYASHGLKDFVVCCGYRGYVIKEYFSNYFLHTSDVTFDLQNNKVEYHHSYGEPWRVTLVDTGAETLTGGRLKRVLPYLGKEPFCMTYGDGVADIDIPALLQFHRDNRKLATVTAVQPPGRFGSLVMEGGGVSRFEEKTPGDGGWINGGFFVIDPAAARYINGDSTNWEQDSMPSLSKDKQLAAYKHAGFWHPMDTKRDKDHLESLWSGGKAVWKKW